MQVVQGNLNQSFFTRYRIQIVSIASGLFFAIIILNVWLTIKSNFDESIERKVEVTAERIAIQVSDAEMTSINIQDFKKLLNQELATYSEFFIEIRNAQNLLVYDSGNRAESLDKYEKQISFGYPIDGNQSWSLIIRTTPTFFEESNYRFIYVGLFIAMTLSFLLGVTVYFGQTSRRNSKRLRLLNDELELARIKAEQASLSKSKFLANMSHEIRTPMNVIMGFISIIKTEKITKKQREYLNLMEVSSKNLLSIVNDILEIEKLESGEVQLTNVSFNAFAELEKMVKMQEAFFEEKGLFLKTNFSGDKNIWVVGDPNKFHQIFTNLIRNAFKFTEEGGLRLQAEVFDKDHEANYRIELSDTGIGIPQEKLNEIFERFNQVDSSPNRKYEGTGLGLAITKKLVEAMGGEIEVTSEIGIGTTFTLNFNFKKINELNEGKGGEDESINEESIRFSDSRVLIIDDQYVNILVIEKTLHHFGVDTDFTENAKDGIRLATENEYDLILMDLHMPEMDGFAATSELKRKGVDIPIVALSADVTPRAKRIAYENGMQDYLTKPFIREKLLTVLKKYLLQEVDGN